MNRAFTRERAFSLVEVAIAVGIAGFALLAILGLLPEGLASNRASSEQTAATNIATMIVSDVKSTPLAAGSPAAAQSPRFGIAVPAAGSTASSTFFLTQNSGWSGGETTPPASSVADSRYRVSVDLTASAGLVITGVVRLTWPPTAALANVAGMVELPIALQR